MIKGQAFCLNEAAKGFTSHDYLADSGLILTRYRAYDPLTGRWLSADPIGEMGGINLFAYVLGDPVNAVDLLGLIDINLNPNNYTVDGKIDKRISGFVINASDTWYKITVYAHGDSNRVGDMRKGFPGIKLTPEDLADIIKNHEGFKDAKEIVLYSCSTGKDPNGFATQLSKLLGLPVWAPNDFLWIQPDGKYTIGSQSTLGIVPGDGKFIKYK